jgi:hypothetical protein
MVQNNKRLMTTNLAFFNAKGRADSGQSVRKRDEIILQSQAFGLR